jgi:sulfoxide reductase heme-binding subunit YedZ
MSGDPTLWILARSTGILSYALLAGTVLAGLTAKSRPVKALAPAATVDVHRFLSLLALMAVGLHGIFLTLDTSVPIPITALLVPGTSPYRPLWVAAGVLAGELMLLVHLSFRFRKRIGVKNWRRLHFATYLVFAGATAHGLMAGTDSARPWALAMYVGATGAVVALTAWRITTPRRRAPASRAPRPQAPAPPLPAPAPEPGPVGATRIPARPAVRFRASAVVPAPGALQYRAPHPPRRPVARNGAPRSEPATSER